MFFSRILFFGGGPPQPRPGQAGPAQPGPMQASQYRPSQAGPGGAQAQPSQPSQSAQAQPRPSQAIKIVKISRLCFCNNAYSVGWCVLLVSILVLLMFQHFPESRHHCNSYFSCVSLHICLHRHASKFTNNSTTIIFIATFVRSSGFSKNNMISIWVLLCRFEFQTFSLQTGGKSNEFVFWDSFLIRGVIKDEVCGLSSSVGSIKKKIIVV